MENGYVRVIGIDPGLAITGVGIIDIIGNRYKPVFCDCIVTDKDKPTSHRLKAIYESFNELIGKFCPTCMAIEDIFFSTNAKTALLIGQARGVLILAGSNNDLDVYEYTPLQVKQAIVGYGRATKQQIKYMLKIILGLNEDFFPVNDDAWDALGIALCHGAINKFDKKINNYIK